MSPDSGALIEVFAHIVGENLSSERLSPINTYKKFICSPSFGSYFFFHFIRTKAVTLVRHTARVIANHVYGSGRSTVLMP